MSPDDDFLQAWRLQARYNAWFNDRLYTSAEALTDAQRKEDRGAFFGSIHATLNHLLVADRIWLRRFRACALEAGWEATMLDDEVLRLPEGVKLDSQLHADWDELGEARRRLDAALEAWVAAMPAGFPRGTMRYATTAGKPREHAAWLAVTHFFNHQTHHRGQVTTLLMQAGVDPGVTDLIAMALQPPA